MEVRSLEPISSHLALRSYLCWLSTTFTALFQWLIAPWMKVFKPPVFLIKWAEKRTKGLSCKHEYVRILVSYRAFKSIFMVVVFFCPSADRITMMSLSRNGTLEKTVSEHALSERGTPSRAGSGVVVPPPYSAGGSEAADPPLELRGSLDCWACSVLVTAQNLIIALINGLVASVVFGTILTPALTMITFGFLCHSTVRIPWRCFSFFCWRTEVW